jgi:predicted nucleic acid-binding protein
MTFVVDANVAVKWVVSNPDTDDARAVISSKETLIAPDLLVAEFTNALWRHILVRDIVVGQAIDAIVGLRKVFSELVRSLELAQPALQLAIDLNCSPYDCLYAALALDRKCGFVTADRKFAERLRSSRRLPGVKLLSDFAR